MKFKKMTFLDALLPSQLLFDRLLVGKVRGELALKWAVFIDGLEEYCNLAVDISAHRSQDFLQEEVWILADDTEWPFSFLNLCETFFIEPTSLRHALIAWKEKHSRGGHAHAVE